ncbi:EP1-like glycoprotein 3 [Chenopodium quinoa]|uniref:Bulb-type lectin domain-containing protein n=1 Tax=Chenopodium quinoa TaxID=63459 RepID=A0A803LC59_CHEQI|nr:EP1-like glycoprotein 3 [Chenopodium quinoa]
MLMNMSSFVCSFSLILSLCFLISPSICQEPSSPSPAPAPLPSRSFPPSIFLYVNQGDFEDITGEFDTSFRRVAIDSPRFSLFFYTNDQKSFTLGIGMGFSPKWVWAANRNAPVGEGAALYLGKDGNLVLVDFDDCVVWQTNTANKGVVGIKMLDNGNMVLYDAKGNFIWQSFDYPSDTLLTGQSLKVGLTTKLVSRASPTSDLEGNYTLEMRPNNVSLYYKSLKNPTPLPYYRIDQIFGTTPSKEFSYIVGVTNFVSHFTFQALQYITTDWISSSNQLLAETWYNSTNSFLRLDIDGKLRTYSYDPLNRDIFKVEFTLFEGEPLPGDQLGATECQMPEKCGDFGVCYKNQCVACPSPRGLLGWSEKCAQPKLECNGGVINAKYYKVVGVRHFSSLYTEGEGITQRKCKSKCSKDCKCAGFFYDEEKLKCLIVNDLKTLTQSDNPKQFGYIKVSNY